MERTIIVVDDEPIIRLDLCQMLEELGFAVAAEGADGFDAVELCRQKHPDIVLLDLEMPIFDGMTAAETIIGEGLAGCVGSVRRSQMKNLFRGPAARALPVISLNRLNRGC